jgi:hypothetical protein
MLFDLKNSCEVIDPAARGEGACCACTTAAELSSSSSITMDVSRIMAPVTSDTELFQQLLERKDEFGFVKSALSEVATNHRSRSTKQEGTSGYTE